MHLGSAGALFVEESADCPIAMCLHLCVDDVERHSVNSAAFLRAAIAELDDASSPPQMPALWKATDQMVLIAYLEYLLPDVGARSRSAATLVRQSIAILRRSISLSPSGFVALH